MVPQQLLLGLALAGGLTYFMTPLAIRVAHHFDFLDKPGGYKDHGRATPYLGGSAVTLAFLLVVLPTAGMLERTVPIVGGVVVMWAVGTLDDRRTVPWWLRVGVELALAAGLWALDLGWHLGAGAGLDLVLTMLWIVAVVNALNLFDNMDGQASTMGLVIAAGLAGLGLVEGDRWLALVSAALAGACLGFLPHNLASPARIFLGDGGSMPIGFAIATLVMVGSAGAAPEWQALAMGVLLVGVPALDTTLVMISRRRRGVSLLTGGRDHLTHRAGVRLRTTRAVALTLGAGQAVLAAVALVSYRGGSVVLLLVVLVYVVASGVTITLLDAPGRHGARDARPAAMSVSTRGGQPLLGKLRPVPVALLLAFAAAVSAAPWAFGFYDTEWWARGGLVWLGVLVALVIARPPRLSGPALLALGGFGALGVWSLASSAWADDASGAAVEGNRLLVYAVVLAVLVALVDARRPAQVLLSALALGTLAVSLWTIAQMWWGDGTALFLGGRLNEPLGYINGMASFYALGCFLWLGQVEHRRSPLLAGAAMAAATLMACAVVLCVSRGALLTLAAGGAATLLLLPGRTRRAVAVLLLFGGVALASGSLVEVYDTARAGTLSPSAVQDAALRTVMVAALSGVLWAGAAAAARTWPSLRPAVTGVLACGGLAIVLIAGAKAGPIVERVSEQYDSFVELGATAAPENRTRLVSGGGNRYDYFRVAVLAWRDAPVLGVGAGGYDRPYFLWRQTAEDVRQPHSLPLQVLAETGAVGGALLALVLGAMGWGVARTRGRVRLDPDEGPLAVAAIGVLAGWWVHTSVDWMHLLPGVTALALAATAVLVRPGDSAPSPTGRPVLRVAGVALLALALTLTAVSLSRQVLAERYAEQGRDLLARDPAAGFAAAGRALQLDPEMIPAYYTRAAAAARVGDGEQAAAQLRLAAIRAPGDYVTWALRGDVAVRMGDLRRARRFYGEALARNPRDKGLQQLARNPLAIEG